MVLDVDTVIGISANAAVIINYAAAIANMTVVDAAAACYCS